MERCPNCDTPSRSGAKFCTTCGFRFSGDNSDGSNTAANANSSPSEGSGQTAESDDEALAGWPSSSADPSSDDSFWAPDRAETPAPGGGERPEPPPATTWPNDAENPWPAPPTDSRLDDSSEPILVVAASAEPVGTSETPGADDSENTRARAERLLDELRQLIATMDGGADADLSGVVSDLEVALEPPGALTGEGLNELREAMLSARERPRDVDTIVDLTRRVDAIVALMFAYDRAIAAIERSLDVLRQQEATPE